MDIGILYVVFNRWISNPETKEIPYKIGITRGSVEDRYYGLGLKMPGEFETLFAYKFDDCAKAEQLIHGILNRKREKGEWFNVNSDEIEIIKTNCEIMGGILVTDEVKSEIKTETETEINPEIETETGKEIVPGNNISSGITARDIFNMQAGDSVSNFFSLIVNSKIPNSENWAGEDYRIKNTPMKGINWIGSDDRPLAVIIRTTGKYTEDNDGKKYAFEAKNGNVDKKIKSNQVIINQKRYKYPIFYFVKKGSKYTLIGKYSVDKEFDTYVTLIPFANNE
jgi:hypothetical protein